MLLAEQGQNGVVEEKKPHEEDADKFLFHGVARWEFRVFGGEGVESVPVQVFSQQFIMGAPPDFF